MVRHIEQFVGMPSGVDKVDGRSVSLSESVTNLPDQTGLPEQRIQRSCRSSTLLD
jgi:hypothetical protein